MSYCCKICFKQIAGEDIIPFFQRFKKEAIARIPEIAKNNASYSPIMRECSLSNDSFQVTRELRKETRDWGSLHVFRYKYFYNKGLGLLGMYHVDDSLEGLFDCVVHFQNSTDQDYPYESWNGIKYFEDVVKKWQNAAIEEVQAWAEKSWDRFDPEDEAYDRRSAVYEEIWANFESTLEDRDDALHLALFGFYDNEPLTRFCVCVEKAVAEIVTEWNAKLTGASVDNERMRCSEFECAPPSGEKEDCEFYENGYCIGTIRPDEDAVKQMQDILHKYGITLP